MPHTQRGGHVTSATGRRLFHDEGTPVVHNGDRPVPLGNFLTLSAEPNAVRLSRVLVSITLLRWGLKRLDDDAELVVSELVTNAVQASKSTRDDPALIHVRVSHLGTSVVVEVWDRDLTPPAMQDVGGDAESGRGLMIVEALAARWGYYLSIGSGKVVWAELDIPPRLLTAVGLPIRIPEPISRGPYDHVFIRDLQTLRRVRRGLKRLK